MLQGVEGLVAGAGGLQLGEEGADALDGKVLDGQLFEYVPPPTRQWAGRRFVHFDIDPQNSEYKKNPLIGLRKEADDDKLQVFVGGLDNEPDCDGEHEMVPRLKVCWPYGSQSTSYLFIYLLIVVLDWRFWQRRKNRRREIRVCRLLLELSLLRRKLIWASKRILFLSKVISKKGLLRP